MALNVDLNDAPGPETPTPLAHLANDLARRATDARRTLETTTRGVRLEINQVAHKKFADARQDHRMVLFSMLAVVFLAALYWEWCVSSEIYAVFFPEIPGLAFFTLAGLAVLASACLAEGSNTFSIFSTTDREPPASAAGIARLYDRRSGDPIVSARTRLVLLGSSLAIGIEIAIYYMSWQRIALLQEAGELAGVAVGLQLWLPVVLYAVELVLGIPTFFCLVAAWDWRCSKSLNRSLTRQRDNELIIRAEALQVHADYLQQFSDWNDKADREGRSPLILVPPCQDLRDLLIAEFGPDFTGHLDQDEPAPADRHQSPVDERTPESADGGGTNGRGDGARVNDLLKIFDEGIDERNLSI